MLVQIDNLGKGVTIGALIGAGVRLDGLGAISGRDAAFYAGAVIASLAVATGKSRPAAPRLADVLFTAKKNKLDRKWLPAILQRWPGVYDRSWSPAATTCACARRHDRRSIAPAMIVSP